MMMMPVLLRCKAFSACPLVIVVEEEVTGPEQVEIQQLHGIAEHVHEVVTKWQDVHKEVRSSVLQLSSVMYATLLQLSSVMYPALC